VGQCAGHNTLIVKRIFAIGILLAAAGCFAQPGIDAFLKPSDSLNKNRVEIVTGAEIGAVTATLFSLGQTWYSDYPKSSFHFIDDNAQWLQMDKAGHLYSSYQMGRFGYEALAWSGVREKDRLIYGGTLGFVFLSAVEVFDGYSAGWGASVGDMAANAGGSALFVGQQLLWKEQRIVPKFSFHTTPYASARPDVLGNSAPEQMLKDYNGQTYWLSVNLKSFVKSGKIPAWLNLAAGYGAEGMITGDDSRPVNMIFLPEDHRFRQYYLSLDADLTKIKTKSHLLKTVFSLFNTVKIPAPTLEYSDVHGLRFRPLYF
jgi:hypothetical protein